MISLHASPASALMTPCSYEFASVAATCKLIALLAPALSVFGTDGTLRGIPCRPFERMATSIVARWFVQSTTEHIELYMYYLSTGVGFGRRRTSLLKSS
jgi:hypothetical protein